MLGHTMGLADVPRPHRSSQAVVAVVRTKDNFLRVLKRHGGHDRPEDFLLNYLHVFAGVHEHGRFDKVPLIRRLVAAAQSGSALGESGLQIAAHPVQLLF